VAINDEHSHGFDWSLAAGSLLTSLIIAGQAIEAGKIPNIPPIVGTIASALAAAGLAGLGMRGKVNKEM
jgi:hypothetical protein